MKILWYVEDGYVNNGPHSCTIDDSDLEGLTEVEQEIYINDYVRGEFENTISFSWERKG